MTGVLTGFAIIAAVVVAGYLVQRAGVLGTGAQRVMQLLAFYVASPCLLLTVLARADVGLIVSRFVVVAIAAALIAGGLYLVLSRLFFRRPVAETAIGMLTAGYVNANNIGLPVAVYVLGDATYVAPVLLVQVLLFTPAVLMVLDLQAGSVVSWRAIATQPLRNPITVGSAAGLVVNLLPWHPPDAVFAPFVLIGGAAVPLMLLAFGMSLRGSAPLQPGAGRLAIATGVLLKIAFMPAAGYLLARYALGMSGHQLYAATVLAALPTAQNVFNYATRYRCGTVVARDCVLLSSVLAVPSMLVIAALLG